MIYTETRLKGAYLVEPEPIHDERGFFARSFSGEDFETRGLVSTFVQCNISLNHRQGTVRGLHFQTAPHAETKLVRCTAGAIHDVILDLRPDSPTFGHWDAYELSAANRLALYVPVGFAHGFQSLVDDAEVFYQISEYYHPECASGYRWNDPAFGITWPLPVTVLSAKDREYPDFTGTKA